MAVEYRACDPDQLHKCPYDEAHMIRASRMPYHLEKCKRNHLDMSLVSCPFNARHRIKSVLLPQHLSQCPDKCILERNVIYQKDNDEKVFKGDCTVPPYTSTWGHSSSNEDWSMDGEASDLHTRPSDLHIEPTDLHIRRTDWHLKPKDLHKASEAVERQPVAGLRLPKTTSLAISALKPSTQSERQTKAPVEPGLTALRGVGRGLQEIPRPQATAKCGVGRGLGISVAWQQGLIGRGRSVSLASAPHESTNPTNSQFIVPKFGGGVTTDNTITTLDSLSPTKDTENGEALNRKSLRRLHKKLREVSMLEERRSNGEMLNDEELSKVFQKSALLIEINELEK